ncbi:hypothetical protein AALB51_07570 [Lachnospiraceae bacterium 62-26]|mgnify:FL=1
MSNKENQKRKCMTAKEIKREILDMDIKKLRIFLNQYCSYKKIGNTYYYSRKEVEELLLGDNNIEFDIGTY